MRASSRTLSQWYPRLATGLEAGLGLERCLTTIPGPPAAGLEALAARLQSGDSLDAALDRAGQWLPDVDRQLLRAGAHSGRLPDAVRRLAARHEAVVRARLGLLLAAAYPLAVLHLGAFGLPVQLLVDGGGPGAYLAAVARVLVPLWAIVGAGVLAVRIRFRPALAALDLVPLVGGFRRARALADLAYVLEAMVVAGARIDLAWLHAGLAAGDRRLEPVAVAAAEAVQRGEPVAPVLAGRREIPAIFAEFYRSGEMTGRLDESLQVLQRQFSDTASTRLKLAAMVYPALLFAAVAVWVGVRVVLFYAGHFRQIEEMMK